MPSLSGRANVNYYKLLDGKPLYIYEDHRWVLNVLFFARYVEKTEPESLPLVFFDRHHDGLQSDMTEIADLTGRANDLPGYKLKERVQAFRKNPPSFKEFVPFVEFDLNVNDDNWVYVACELGLVSNVVVVGATEGDFWTEDPFVDATGTAHRLITLPLPHKWRSKQERLFEEATEGSDFFLDFDLDCFTVPGGRDYRAWSDERFRRFFQYPVGEYPLIGRIQEWLQRARLVTIARESKCCGGIRHANAILANLDRWLFSGVLDA